MTDGEIIRLCAEAMGWRWEDAKDQFGNSYLMVWRPSQTPWNPLHDDAQCMALVKKFWIGIFIEPEDGQWTVSVPDGECFSNPNLNRAICECVAKMQLAKKGAV